MADQTPVLGQDSIVPQEVNNPSISHDPDLTLQELAKKYNSQSRGMARSFQLPEDISRRQFQKRIGTYANVEGYDIPEAIAQSQSATERIGYLIPRAGVKAAKEIAAIPGYMYGFGKWAIEGFDPEEYGNAFNNAWVVGLNQFNENLNAHGLPVYTPQSVEDGDMWTKLSSASFWANEGADGVGFLVGMMAPGAILRWAKAGEALAGVPKALKAFTQAEKLGKPGFEIAGSLMKSQKTANLINDWTAASVNTIFESAVEGVDAFNGYIEQNPGDTSGAGRAASRTFLANNAILLGPNALNQKWLFGGINRSKVVENAIGKSAISKQLNKILTTTGELIEETPKLSTLAKVGKGTKELGKGIFAEGIWEEGMQYVVSERAKRGESSLDIVGDVTDWLENLTSDAENTDFWSGVVLGGIMGGGMSTIGAVKEANRTEKTVSAYHELLKHNSVNYLKTLKDMAVVVDGKPQFKKDGSGRYELDPEKVIKAGQQVFQNASLRDYALKTLKAGDKEGSDMALELLHFDYMLPWLQIEGGKDLLARHIKSMAKDESNNLEQELGIKTATVEEIEKDLSNKIDKFSKIYEQVNDTHDLNFDVRYDKADRDAFDAFSQDIKNAKLSTKVRLQYSLDRVNKLRDELASYEKGSIAIDQTKVDENLSKELRKEYEKVQKTANFDKNDKSIIENKLKYIDAFSKAYNGAEEALNNLYDKTKLQKGFDDKIEKAKLLKEKKKSSEATKNIIDPKLKEIYENNVMEEDLSSEGRTIKLRHQGESQPFYIPGQNISVKHRGIIKITYQKADGTQESVLAVVGEATNRGTLALKTIKIDKKGVETPVSNKVDFLNSADEIFFSGHKYKVTNIEQYRTPAESRTMLEHEAALNELQQEIDDYNTLIAHKSESITSAIAKIRKYRELIKTYLKEYKTEIITQKNIKALYKDGKISEDVITKKEALAIAKLYKTTADINTQIDVLITSRDTIQKSKNSYKERQKAIKEQLKGVKAGDVLTINSLNEKIKRYEEAEQEALGLWKNARSAIVEAQKTISNIKRVLKGYNTSIAKILGDDMKGLDLSDQALQIEHLPEDEKEEVRSQVIMYYFSKLDKEITEEDANVLFNVSRARQTLENRLALAEQALKDLQETDKESGDNYWSSRKAKELTQLSKSRLFNTYKSLVHKYFKASDIVEEDLIDAEKQSSAEADFAATFELEADRIKAWEINALHSFEDWTSFLHATSNQSLAKSEPHVARWFAFVNNLAYKRTKDGKNPKYAYATMTFDQVSKIKNANIRDQINFWIPDPKSAEKGRYYSYKELRESKDETLIAKAKDDIKYIVVNYSNSNPYMPALFTKDGDESTEKVKGGMVIYTSLPLPTAKRDTVEAVRSGGDRFSYKKLEADYRAKKIAEGTKEEDILQSEIDSYVLAKFNEARDEYEEFRGSLKKEPIVLDMAYVNPGVKNENGVKDSGIEIEEAIVDPLYKVSFFIKHSIRKETGEAVDVELTISGRKYYVRSGFLYMYHKNRLEPVKPKTLEQTNSVNDILNLFRYVASGREGSDNVLTYLKTALHMTSATDFDWRLYFVTKKDKDGNPIPGQMYRLVYNGSSITVDDLVANRNTEGLIEFLKTKYWNFDKDMLHSTADFTEYHASKDLTLTRTIWQNKVSKDEKVDETNPNVKRMAGGYKGFLFSSKGKNPTKGLVKIRPAPKGKENKHLLLAKEPQYLNQSLQLQERKEMPKEEVLTTGEINEAGILLKLTLDVKEGSSDPKIFHIIYHPNSKSWTFEHPELTKDMNIPKIDGKTFPVLKELFSKGLLNITSDKADFMPGVIISISSVKDIMPQIEKEVVIKDSGLTEAGNEVTGELVEKNTYTLQDQELLDLADAMGMRDDFVKQAEEILRSEGVELSDEVVNEKANELIIEDGKKQSRNRLARIVDEYEKEDINSAKEWFRKRFPSFPIKEIEGLIDNVAWGRLEKGSRVLISTIAEIGTVYHEAFHVWSNIYNSDHNRALLYDETRKRLGNAKLTDDQCEEILAEEFRDYMMMGSAYKFNNGETVKKGFFEWLVDSILEFFRALGFDIQKGDNMIEDAFAKLANGTFTNPLSSTTKTFDRLEGLSPALSLALIQDVNTMFFNSIIDDVQSGGDIIFNLEKDPKSIYKRIQYNYAKDLARAKGAGNKIEASLIKNILDRWDKITVEHALFLTQYKTDIRESLEEDDLIQRNSRDSKYTLTRPIKDYAPLPIRLLIGAMPSVIRQANGEIVRSRTKYTTLSNVDYAKTMNLLSSELAIVTTVQGMLNKINILSEERPEFSKLFTWLGGTKKASELSNTQLKLIAQFFHTFSANKNNPFAMVIHNDGLVTHTRLADETEKEVIKKSWIESAQAIVASGRPSYFRLKDNDYILNREAILADLKMAHKIPVQILNKLGIVINSKSLYNNDAVREYLTTLREQIQGYPTDAVLTLNDIYDRNKIENQREMNALANVAADNLLNDSDLMYVNQKGHIEWMISRNSHISEVTNRLNELSEKLYHSDTLEVPESIENIMPFDGNIGSLYSLNSIWLDAILQGEGAKIEFHLLKGVKDQSGDGIDLDDSTYGDFKMASFNSVLNNIIPLMRAADRGPEYAFRLGKTNYGMDKEIFADTMFRYLYDEVITTIAIHKKLEQFGYGLKNYTENAKKLRTFSFIYDTKYNNNDYIDSIEDFLASPGKEGKTFQNLQDYTKEFIENNREVLHDTFIRYINTLVENNRESLIESSVIVAKGDGLWQTPGISPDIIEKDFKYVKDGAGRISSDQLNNILVTHAYNYFVGTQEQLKLFLGDPASYDSAVNFHKRTTSSASTRQQSINEPDFLSAIDEMYPRLNQQPRSSNIRNIIVDKITDGNETLGAMFSEYKKMDVADGQMWATLDFIRDLHLRSGSWTDGREMVYQYEMQKLAIMVMGDPELMKIWNVDRAMFEEEGGVFYKHTNGIVPEFPMFNGSEISVSAMEQIPPIKTLGAGYVRGVNISALNINKMSVTHLFPSTLGKDGIKLYLSMIANNIDKIGDSTTTKTDYYINKLDLKNDVITNKHIVTEMSYDDYGIQLEVQDEFKNFVKDSVQKNSVIFNNMMDGGNLKSEVKGLAQDIEDSVDIHNLLYDRNKKEVINELGLEVDNNGKYYLPNGNTSVFVDKLKKLFIQRLMPLNSVEGIDVWGKSKNKVLELLSDHKKVEQVLVALVKNNTIARRVSGEMFVQEAVYLYSEDLKTYREEDGKVLPMEVMVPIPDRWMRWVNSIGGVDALNRLLEAGKLPENVITFLANRIPTSDINTVEACKIVKFLPNYVGAKIVLPKEIVAKTSSDFDIDKLTTYLNSLRMTKDGPRVHEFMDDSNSTVEERYEAYIRPEEIEDDPLLDAIQSLFNDDILTPKPSISFEEFKELSILEQNTTKSLDNRLNDIHMKALLHPARFKHLMQPHSGSNIKKLANDYYEPTTFLEQVEDREQNDFHIINQWWFNMKKGLEFWQGLKGVAFAASQNTVNSALQKAPIKIESPTVTLFFEDQELVEGERYTNGFIKDSDGYDITDNYGQALVSFVDVAKDSYIFKANIFSTNYGIVSFLNRNGRKSGVGLEHIIAFMSHPVIKKYLSKASNRWSKFAHHNEYTSIKPLPGEGRNKWFETNIGYPQQIVDDMLSELQKKYTKRYKKTSYNIPKSYQETVAAAVNEYFNASSEEAKQKALTNIKNRSAKYKYLTIEQLKSSRNSYELTAQVLDNYLTYELYARKNNSLNASLRSYSSATFPKSLGGIDAKLSKLTGVLEDGFFNSADITNHIYKTNLRGSTGVYTTTSEMFNWASILRKNEGLSDKFQTMFVNQLAQSGYISEKVEKVLEQAKAGFMSFLYSFNKGRSLDVIRKDYEALFIGENSLPKQLAKIKKKIGNELFSVLRSVINERDPISGNVRNYDYISTFNKRYGISQEDVMVATFEELLQSKDAEVKAFADNLFKFGLYQSGLYGSAISFVRLLPSSVYIDQMDNLISTMDKDLGLESREMGVYFNSFVDQFYRNNAHNADIVYRHNRYISDPSKDINVSRRARASKYEYITVRFNKTTYAERQFNKKNKKRNPYEIILFKKSSVNDKGFVYSPVEKLGDGFRFQEYYPTIHGSTVPSILNTNKVIQPVDSFANPDMSNINSIALTKPFSRESVTDDSDYIYLFTDNAKRTSGSNTITANSWYVKKYGRQNFPGSTQAVIRGLDNAFPITTMVDNKRTQWNDKYFDKYKKIIDDEIATIKSQLPKFKGIKYSSAMQFGAGKISNMKNTAPKVWAYLNKKLLEIGIDNVNLKPVQSRPVNDQLNELDRKLYQLEDIEQYPPPNDDVDNAMRDYLTAIGVSYKAVDTIQKITGSKNPAIAVANLTKMTLEVIEGSRNIRTLPEEAAHFYVASLDENSGFYQKMYTGISDYSVYHEVAEKYKDIENYSDKDIREEAMGKLIAERIVDGQFSTTQSERQARQAENWWLKLWGQIKSLFDRSSRDPYARAAYEIYIKGVEGYRITKKKESALPQNNEFKDPVEEWHNLRMTPRGIYKYVYKRNATEGLNTYDHYVSLFGEDNVTLVNVNDPTYKVKIVIKKPNVTNEATVVGKEMTAQANVREMSKAPFSYDGNLLFSNFNKYFPDLDHLEEEEKLSLLKSIEMGETELYCSF